MLEKWNFSSKLILNVVNTHSKYFYSILFKSLFLILVFCKLHLTAFAEIDLDQLQKLVASDRAAGDQFSISVSIDGNYAIVGAHTDDKDASGLNALADAGSAYIFVRSGSTWSLQQKLVASDRAAGDQFGFRVSINGNYAVVSARLDDKDASGLNPISDAGSAYIFVRSGTTWSQQQKLVASDRGTSDQFGFGVSVSNEYVIISASVDDEDASGGNFLTSAGSAYIFVRSGTTWSQQQKIVPSDRAANDWFGWSVSINGDYAIIGAPREDEDASGGNTISDAGSAYIFVRNGATWTQQQKIVASDRAGDWFGISVSINGSYIILGSRFDDKDASGLNALADAGSAYIFVRSGTTWSQQQKLVATDRAAGDEFGIGVSIYGDYAIVGAFFEDENASGANTLSGAGSAYIFTRIGNSWSQQQKIVPTDRSAGDNFGASVAISSEYALVNSYLEDEDASGGNTLADAGSAYIFKITAGPTFTTTNASSISSLSAISGGVITSSGTNPILQRGIVWDVNPNPTIALSTKTSDGAGVGEFLSRLSSLVQTTTYYVRAYATTLYGTYYGNEISFTTPYKIELDGNQDGTLDSNQAHVHTFYDYSGIKLMTIVDLNNYSLSEVSASISNEQTYYYPYGLINFKVAATQTQVKIIFHGTSSLTGYDYRKLFSDNRIRKYDYAVFGSEVIAGNTVATVTLTLVDGGIGDSDGIVNGIITDPGGPAIAVVISNIPTLSEWARILLISLLAIFGFLYLKPHRA